MTSLENIPAENDTAGDELAEAKKQARLAWERHAEKDRAYGQALRERDAARAEVIRLLAMLDMSSEQEAQGDAALERCRNVLRVTAEGWRHEVAEIAKIIGEDPHTAYLADAVRRVVEERDGLKWELDMAQKFHDVAVKERDYLRVRLARLERESVAGGQE